MNLRPETLEIRVGEWRGCTVYYRAGHIIIKVIPQDESQDESEEKVLEMVRQILEQQHVSSFEHRAIIGRWTYWKVDDNQDIPALARTIRQDPLVEYAEPDLAMRPAARPNDKYLNPQTGGEPSQWAIDHLRMPEAWDSLYQGFDVAAAPDEVVIGLLDSGVPIDPGINPEDLVHGAPMVDPASGQDMVNHEDLDGRRFLAGLNYEYSPPIPYPQDTYGHGTEMAGIIAATPNNAPAGEEVGFGIAGMNWHSPVYVCRVFGDTGGLIMEKVTIRRETKDGETTETVTTEIVLGGPEEHSVTPTETVDTTVIEEVTTQALVYRAIAEVLDYADNTGRHAVINLSATFLSDYMPADGESIDDGTLSDQSLMLTEKGGILVCATGNNFDLIRFPAAAASLHPDTVVAVGETAEGDNVNARSNYGGLVTTVSGEQLSLEVSVVAPGTCIMTTNNDSFDPYGDASGTSVATAHVTGLVSLMWCHNPTMTAAQIIQCLKRTSRIPCAIWKESTDRSNLKWLYGEGLINPVCALKAIEWDVTVVPSSVNFEDIPQDEAPSQMIQLSVDSCADLEFKIDYEGDDFGLPDECAHTLPDCDKSWPEDEECTDDPPCLACNSSIIELPVKYSRDLPDEAGAKVTITWLQHKGLTEAELEAQGLENQQFEVYIKANRVGPRRSAIMLALDKSGSMKRPVGIGPLSRMSLVKFSSSILVDLVEELSAIGVVSFNKTAGEVSDITVITPLEDGAEPPNPVREALKSDIDGISAGGWTSIGAGILKAGEKLDGVPDDLVEGDEARAVIVVTDGVNNRPPSVSDVLASGFAYPVYAIGVGSPESLDSDDLIALADMTGGYTAITGPLSDANQNLIAKFYQQMLAEIDADSVILDPEQRLLPGPPHEFGLKVTNDDRRLDVTVIRPPGAPIDVELLAPGRGEIDPHDGIVTTQQGTLVTRYRVAPPGGGSGELLRAGTWSAKLSIQQSNLERFLGELRRPRSEIQRINTHGVPYALQAVVRSTLRMHARVYQNSFAPGADLLVRAIITGSDLPLSDAIVFANITRPDGGIERIQMRRRTHGVYETAYTTTAPGVYMCRIVAQGYTPLREKYRREKLLTGVVLNPRVRRVQIFSHSQI